MKFEWDEGKRLINLQRHGIDFVGVSEVFDDPNALTVLDDRFDYGEVRFVTFELLSGRMSPSCIWKPTKLSALFQ